MENILAGFLFLLVLNILSMVIAAVHYYRFSNIPLTVNNSFEEEREEARKRTLIFIVTSGVLFVLLMCYSFLASASV